MAAAGEAPAGQDTCAVIEAFGLAGAPLGQEPTLHHRVALGELQEWVGRGRIQLEGLWGWGRESGEVCSRQPALPKGGRWEALSFLLRTKSLIPVSTGPGKGGAGAGNPDSLKQEQAQSVQAGINTIRGPADLQKSPSVLVFFPKVKFNFTLHLSYF